VQRWRAAPDRSGGILPEAVISDLMERDLSDHDYELLLQLDKSASYDTFLASKCDCVLSDFSYSSVSIIIHNLLKKLPI